MIEFIFLMMVATSGSGHYITFEGYKTKEACEAGVTELKQSIKGLYAYCKTIPVHLK